MAAQFPANACVEEPMKEQNEERVPEPTEEELYGEDGVKARQWITDKCRDLISEGIVRVARINSRTFRVNVFNREMPSDEALMGNNYISRSWFVEVVGSPGNFDMIDHTIDGVPFPEVPAQE